MEGLTQRRLQVPESSFIRCVRIFLALEPLLDAFYGALFVADHSLTNSVTKPARPEWYATYMQCFQNFQHFLT